MDEMNEPVRDKHNIQQSRDKISHLRLEHKESYHFIC